WKLYTGELSPRTLRPEFSLRAKSRMDWENGVSGWRSTGSGSDSAAAHKPAAAGTTPTISQPRRWPNSDGVRNSLEGVLSTRIAPTASGHTVMDWRSFIRETAAGSPA